MISEESSAPRPIQEFALLRCYQVLASAAQGQSCFTVGNEWIEWFPASAAQSHSRFSDGSASDEVLRESDTAAYHRASSIVYLSHPAQFGLKAWDLGAVQHGESYPVACLCRATVIHLSRFV